MRSTFSIRSLKSTRTELWQGIWTAESATSNEVEGPVCTNVQPRSSRRTEQTVETKQKETRERKVSFGDSRRRETERAEAFQLRKKLLKFSSLMTPKVRLIDMKQFQTSHVSLHFDEKASIGTFACCQTISMSLSTIETEVWRSLPSRGELTLLDKFCLCPRSNQLAEWRNRWF